MAIVFPRNHGDLIKEFKIDPDSLAYSREVLKALNDFDSVLILNVRGFPRRENVIPFVVLDKLSGVTLFVPCGLKFFSIDKFTAALQQSKDWKSQAAKVLGSHRQLKKKINDEIFLKIPLRVITFFPHLKKSEVYNVISSLGFDPEDIPCMFKTDKEFPYLIRKQLGLDNIDGPGVSSDELNAAIQMIAPEYIIPKFKEVEIDKSSVNENSIFEKIDDKLYEQVNPAVQISEDQISLVNNIREGNWLFLSCAGSGKSVLLLARAIKLARMFPESKILITFYNNSLSSFYKWRLECAGVSEKNITCKTFHALCRELLENHGLSYDFPREIADDERWELLVKKVSDELIASGSLKTNFDFVFIDEIQDFSPHWYQICWELISDKRHYIFNIAGDITQDIRGRIRKDATPWRGEGLPKYTGRTTKITKNYRNSSEINKFARTFNQLCNSWAVGKNLELNEDDFLIGHSDREAGVIPQIHLVPSKDEVSKVITLVKNLKERGVGFTDILVCYPLRSYNSYKIDESLKDGLRDEGIPFSVVGEKSMETAHYWSYSLREGISLSTVGKVKGLDFTAVIICGFKSLENKYISGSDVETLKFMKSIYTAITRARDHLHLVSSSQLDKEIITKLAVDSMGKEQDD